MQIGIIGLGKMGQRIVSTLIHGGHEVFVWNRSEDTIEEFLINYGFSDNKKLHTTKTIRELVLSLKESRIIWSMLPAGDVTEQTLSEVEQYVVESDIIIDGGNANYEDTERRSINFIQRKIRFLGIGVSGGILAEKNGFALMVGGDKTAFTQIEPLLQTLAAPNGGFAYVGEGGAGHFAKMIHNGIEYGVMQAIGEGFGVLEKSPYSFDLYHIAKLYQKGTIISSFLLDRAVEALSKDKTLSQIEGVIAQSGEAAWTIEAAKKENVPVPVIEESLLFRKESQKNKTIAALFAAKLIAAIRHEFGGHEVKKNTIA